MHDAHCIWTSQLPRVGLAAKERRRQPTLRHHRELQLCEPVCDLLYPAVSRCAISCHAITPVQQRISSLHVLCSLLVLSGFHRGGGDSNGFSYAEAVKKLRQ